MKPEISIDEIGRGKEMNLDEVNSLVQEGKQLGVRYSYPVNGEILFACVGIQKWKGFYKVYIIEYFEAKMIMDEEEREVLEVFELMEDAIDFIEANTYVKFEQFTSWKGNKIFNPTFE